MERGERIDILVDKTDSLNQAAFQFKKRSTALKRKMWWKNSKLLAFIVLLVLVCFQEDAHIHHLVDPLLFDVCSVWFPWMGKVCETKLNISSFVFNQ